MTSHAQSLCVGLILLTATGRALADEPSPLRFDAPAASTETATRARQLSPTPDALMTPKMQPQSVMVTLINGSSFTGTLSDADQWTMKTTFGTANLPLSAVAGIHMAQEGSATTTVALHNGDNITGALEIDHVTLQTDWGRAEILGTHVASILFTTGLKWTSEAGLNGTRWKLVAADARPAAAATSPPTVAAQQRGAAPNRPGGRP